ncbi:DUF4870 domain-containing protein [Brachybacterium sp. YJGR34]|uniref:DUF4870 domain-containing protein n=1 Tax=Brachybacterium sp. YJGR34 TaxID=2059911 RepID=UPI000E0B385F|nr:DUF4870 domain-containing protein [Brachybacterium sp. YJGR34]
MSQTPHPHDPYGSEPGAPADEQAPQPPRTDRDDPFDLDAGSPTSDPALHPHDPYAVDPAAAAPPASDPYSAPAPQNPQGAPGPQYGAPPQGSPVLDVPPPGTKGVFEGPLTGQPTTDADGKLWAMFAQLSVILGHALSWGFLGWVGPLIIFLIYKDRNRFTRFHAAEALNGAIAVVIVQIVLGIVLTLFGIITLGFGFFLMPLVGLPALVQLIFSIIAAVKANQGEYWNYPVSIRLVK